MSVPCAKTLRNWCTDAFDLWLEASEEGSATSVAWTLGNSKFDKNQIFRWFAFKDKLYQAQSDGGALDRSDSDSLGDKFDHSTRK